jgi:hypothetical protein
LRPRRANERRSRRADSEWELRKALAEVRTAPESLGNVAPSDSVTQEPRHITAPSAKELVRQTTIGAPIQELIAQLIMQGG